MTNRRSLIGAAGLGLAGMIAAPAANAQSPAGQNTADKGTGLERALPAPMKLTISLTDALQTRNSVRRFSDKPLQEAELASILWAAAGRTRPDGRRTVPSAKNCREIDPYVFDAQGVWRYDGARHTLVQVAAGDMRAATTQGQDFVSWAAASIVFIADMKRGRKRMPPEDILRWTTVDCGCMVQAAQLACAALGLASLPRGSIDAAAVRKAANLSMDDLALMALTVGRHV